MSRPNRIPSALVAASLAAALVGCGESGGVSSTPVQGNPTDPAAPVGAAQIPGEAPKGPTSTPSLPANSKLKLAPTEQL